MKTEVLSQHGYKTDGSSWKYIKEKLVMKITRANNKLCVSVDIITNEEISKIPNFPLLCLTFMLIINACLLIHHVFNCDLFIGFLKTTLFIFNHVIQFYIRTCTINT